MSLVRSILRDVVTGTWSAPLDPLLRQAALAATAARKAFDPTLPQTAKHELDAFYLDAPHGGKRPLLLGHRGAMARAPENTLGAFQAALDDGGRGVELDVTLAGDSVPVVLHDDTLDRTTNIHGKPTDYDSDELAALDAGSWFHAAGRGHWGPEKVPRLTEVLASMPDGAVVNVELKGPTPAYVCLERRVVDVVRQFPRVQVIISSFHPAQLLEVRRIASDIPIGLLVADDSVLPSRTAWTTLLLMPDAIHPPARIVDRPFVDGAKAAGLRVHVWGVRSIEEGEFLLGLGVDGLIVDDVAAFRPLFG